MNMETKKKSSSLEEETMNYLKKNHNYEKKRMISKKNPKNR